MHRIFFLAACLTWAFPANAQTRNGILFEAGPILGDWGSVVKTTAFWHLNDQWVLDAGLKHQTDFPKDHPAGHVQAIGHVRYFLDILQIVPSLYLGVGAGRMLALDVPVFSLEYGVSADYMYSRKFLVGLSFGGVTTTYGEGLTDPHGQAVSSRTNMLLLLRLQWVFGETW